MLSNIFYYRYPQYVWTCRIAKILSSGLAGDLNRTRFIDAPCGDGIISYWLKRRFPGLQIELFDIDESSIRIARRFIKDVNAETMSIFDLEPTGDRTVWLLINSLYCLPDKEKLLQHMGKQVAKIIGVFPYTERDNYQAFLRLKTDFVNPSAMTQEQTLAFLDKYGFEPILVEDVSFMSRFRWQELGLGMLSKRVLNVLDPLASNREGQYWLAILERAESP